MLFIKYFFKRKWIKRAEKKENSKERKKDQGWGDAPSRSCVWDACDGMWQLCVHLLLLAARYEKKGEGLREEDIACNSAGRRCDKTGRSMPPKTYLSAYDTPISPTATSSTDGILESCCPETKKKTL